MRKEAPIKDLVVLMPDKNWETTVKTLLDRRGKALKIRKLNYDRFVHVYRDSGIYHGSGDFLRPFQRSYQYALVLLDQEWKGGPNDRCVIRQHIQEDLDLKGWKDRSAVIVVEPELEAWVWSDSPHVSQVLGWAQGDLLAQLALLDFRRNALGKPERPKEVLTSILRAVRKPPFSALFGEIALKVSLDRCTDQSFLEFRAILSTWFSSEVNEPRHPS